MSDQVEKDWQRNCPDYPNCPNLRCPCEPALKPANSGRVGDETLRDEWRRAGGSIHGPHVETVTMPEATYFSFRRALAALAAHGHGDPIAWLVVDAKGKRFAIYNRELAQAIKQSGEQLGSTLTVKGVCEVPPQGWYCTRQPGHEGPCAAWENEPSASPAGVPDGWRLVPVESTSEMDIAGADTAESCGAESFGRNDAERVWSAMLANAPSAPSGVPDALYRNACDSVESWKARALEAEETAERLVAVMNDMTGPTFMGEPRFPKANGVPDANDLAQLKKAMEDWNDGVDTDVPQHTLMRLTELGLLVAEQFEVTKKGMDLLAAAPSAPEGDHHG